MGEGVKLGGFGGRTLSSIYFFESIELTPAFLYRILAIQSDREPTRLLKNEVKKPKPAANPPTPPFRLPKPTPSIPNPTTHTPTSRRHPPMPLQRLQRLLKIRHLIRRRRRLRPPHKATRINRKSTTNLPLATTPSSTAPEPHVSVPVESKYERK